MGKQIAKKAAATIASLGGLTSLLYGADVLRERYNKNQEEKIRQAEQIHEDIKFNIKMDKKIETGAYHRAQECKDKKESFELAISKAQDSGNWVNSYNQKQIEHYINKKENLKGCEDFSNLYQKYHIEIPKEEIKHNVPIIPSPKNSGVLNSDNIFDNIDIFS
jgi:hypothetical protein